MQVFSIRESEYTPNYNLVGTHKWGLPGIRCGVCNRTWTSIGRVYPKFSLPVDLPEKPFIDGWPVSNEEFGSLQRALQRAWSSSIPLPPGTLFGPLSGKGSGRFLDFAWLHSWVPLIHEETLQRMSDNGINTLTTVAPTIALRGKTAFKHLELHVEPYANVDLGTISTAAIQSCDACGWFRLPERKFPTPENAFPIKRSSVPRHLDLFRIHECSGILCSERFMKVVRDLKLTGIDFQHYPISDS